MIPPLKPAFVSRAKYFASWLTELAAPALRLWAGYRTMNRRPSNPSEWRKGLLLGANHIGDILYRTCALETLAAAFPRCEWHILAPQPACEILEGNPAIRLVHRFELPSSKRDSNFALLRAQAYDVAICYDIGMYAKPLTLAVNLGIPNRVSYVHKGFSAFSTHPIPIRYPQPFAHYFNDLVRNLTGCSIPNSSHPKVYPSDRDREEANTWLSRIDTGLPVVAIFLSTRQPTNLWPRDRFIAVARILSDRRIALPVLCGSPHDGAMLQDLRRQASLDIPVIAGELNLRALVHFLSQCAAVLTPDSGPRHLANAAGARVFFFRNLRSHEIETGPYCSGEQDLLPPGSFCSSAEQERILANVTVEEIVRKLQLAVSATPYAN